MKYRVFIADDHTLIRQSLIQTIDWSKLGCEICGETADGREAYHRICELHPDIAILDIKMPEMDGLELCKQLQITLPSLQTIIITGFPEFEYAQRALRLGVCDLITKPIDNQQLERVVQNITAQMEAPVDIHIESVQKQRERILRNIINQKQENLTQAQTAPLQASQYLWVTVENTAQEINWEACCGRALAPLINTECPFDLVVILVEAKWRLLLLFHKPIDEQQLICIRNEIFRLLSQEGHGDTLLSFSNLFDDVQAIYQEFQIVCQIANYHFFVQNKQMLYPEVLPTSEHVTEDDLLLRFQRFYEICELLSADEVHWEINSLLQGVIKYSKGNVVVAKGLLTEIYLSTMKIYRASEHSFIGLQSQIDMALMEINQMTRLSQAEDYLTKFINQLWQQSDKKQKRMQPMVKRVIDEIKLRYAEELTLGDMAQMLRVNQSYLSRVIKREVGKNFSVLLTEERIAHAKQLLRDSTNKVSQIGEQVGYMEYSYFYQVFKKTTGLTPVEYREKKLRKK